MISRDSKRPRRERARGAAKEPGSSQRSRKRSRSYHHGDLRRALLEAAVAIVHERGSDAVTLREVARRVGVSQMAPYHHFVDKEALLAAVAEQGFQELTAVMIGRIERLSSPIERLKATCPAYVHFAVTHPSEFKVMFGGALADFKSHPSLLAASEHAFGVLMTCVEECQRAGLLGTAPSWDLAIALWSGAHGLASLWIDGPIRKGCPKTSDVGRLAEFVATTLERGVVTKPVRRPRALGKR